MKGYTHTRLTTLCPIWILLKQETVTGSGISWAICKSAPRSWQITMPAPHHSVFHRLDALPAAQPTASKHWRHVNGYTVMLNVSEFGAYVCSHRHMDDTVPCIFTTCFCTTSTALIRLVQWVTDSDSGCISLFLVTIADQVHLTFCCKMWSKDPGKFQNWLKNS